METFTITPEEQALLSGRNCGPVLAHLARTGRIEAADVDSFHASDWWELVEQVADGLWCEASMARDRYAAGETAFEALARRATELLDAIDEAVDFCARCGELDDACECYGGAA